MPGAAQLPRTIAIMATNPPVGIPGLLTLFASARLTLGVHYVGSAGSPLGAQRRQLMLLGEDVRVEICHPLLALLGHSQVAERLADIRAHLGPEELGIRAPQLGRCLAA